MIVENDWIQTNIRDRLTNENCDFKITISPYKFKEYSFNIACKRAATNIGNKYDKIYLALSGGLDSSHVFKTFVKYEVDFIPVIVRIKGNNSNRTEIEQAIKLCNENNIKPRLIEIDEKECLNTYYDKIFKTIKGYGIYSVAQYLIGLLAKEENAIVVTGENPINVYSAFKTDLSVSEWDYYIDLIDPNILIPFHMYSLEVVNAMVAFAIGNNLGPLQVRSKLYGSKYEPVTNEYTSTNLRQLTAGMINLIPKKLNTSTLGTFQKFYSDLDQWRK